VVLERRGRGGESACSKAIVEVEGNLDRIDEVTAAVSAVKL